MGVIRTYHKDLDMLLNNDTKTNEDDRHQQNIDEQKSCVKNVVTQHLLQDIWAFVGGSPKREYLHVIICATS